MARARFAKADRGNESSVKIKAGVAQLVEHDLAKVGVASPSLVSRSKGSFGFLFFYECRKDKFSFDVLSVSGRVSRETFSFGKLPWWRNWSTRRT